MLLGCLWGAQLVRELNWEWCEIHFDDGLDVALVSPARDMVIFPFTFINSCLEKQVVCTVELSFNILIERTPEYDTGSYLNLMDYVHHIVPPYTLERET
ncbi:hypothetical protein Mal15_69310 [Stieleria maiorica]|uniref:Uncharacterized protein n=1 Tax=Stieleria maiorica TaxID=2795974 RepID=A0A5B9MQS6_9BACT|nr:hypothetical protein Mal15_69310 [Stieleria maiorica]